MSTHSSPSDFEIRISDVEYRLAEGQAWLARVYQPCCNGSFPAILDVHGGAWNQGDRTNNEYIDQQLAASGFLVVAVDFRLAPQYPYPAQVVDINFATRWLKAHAQQFNGDPLRLGILGTSSGGHTAMLSAMRPHDTRYAALPLPEAPALDATVAWVLALWPVLDPYARYLYAKEAGREELVTRTRNYFLTEEAMKEGNPQLLLERKEKVQLPPVLIIQGTSDNNIPLSIPKKFANSYRMSGGELELELFPDMPHGFANKSGAETRRAIEIMKTWLVQQMKAKNPILPLPPANK